MVDVDDGRLATRDGQARSILVESEPTTSRDAILDTVTNPADHSPSVDDWAGPSRLARALAVALAIVIAVVIFLVVNRVWRGAAPAPPKPPSVEVKLVNAPPAVPAR